MSKTLYTAMTTWQGPYDTEDVVYLAGITPFKHTFQIG